MEEKYEDYSTPERRSDSLSDEGQQQQLLRPNPSPAADLDNFKGLRLRSSRVRFYACSLILSSIAILIIVSATLGLQVSRQLKKLAERPVTWLPPSEETSELFLFEPIFGEEPSPAVEAEWVRLIPKGKGFVFINETTLPDMPGLDQSLYPQRAMVSVFHQLHCLYVTRLAYFSVKAGNLEEVNIRHLNHCWDYLRQSIMCFGDTTLEWLPKPPNDVGSTGWGYEHACKNYWAIYEWAEKNRVTDKKVIIH